MLRHVAVFRFTPEFSSAERAHWVQLLRSLPDHVAGLKSLTVGENTVAGPAAHDLAIVADFVDQAALEEYNRHPIHEEVLRISAPVKTSLAVVDFEIDNE